MCKYLHNTNNKITTCTNIFVCVCVFYFILLTTGHSAVDVHFSERPANGKSWVLLTWTCFSDLMLWGKLFHSFASATTKSSCPSTEGTGVNRQWGSCSLTLLFFLLPQVFVACQRTLVCDSTLLPALVSPQLQEKPLRQERPLTQEVQPTSDCMSQSSDLPPSSSSSSSFHFSSRTRIST